MERSDRCVFHEFAGDKPEWADVISLIDNGKPPPWRVEAGYAAGQKPPDDFPTVPCAACRWIFGPLRHAPMNEGGVIFLFGKLAEPLGFMIDDGIQPAFPDCEAKRQVGQDAWQNVTIEFEYESRNFRDHCHPSEGCDIIVCWRHNWPDCPKNLEVIALSEEVERLRNLQTTEVL